MAYQSFAAGNHLVRSDGSISLRNVMRHAHQNAKHSHTDYKAFQARQAGKHVNLRAQDVSYASHLSDALSRAWTRAHQMLRMAAAAPADEFTTAQQVAA
jgi:hypothetical protein